MAWLLDATASRYLRQVRDEVGDELGAELVGSYLYGSSVAGHFVAGQSDLDVLVVVDAWLPVERVRDLLARVRAVTRPGGVGGLDLLVVPRHSAQDPQADPPFQCWLLTSIDSELIGGRDHPGDARLVLLYQMCREHGVALAGPPAREVFGELERSWIIDAMRVDLTLRGAAGWYRVLNACRTVHFLEEGTMCPKLVGASWYRPRLADPWLVDAAVSWRRTGRGPVMPPDAVEAFVGSVLARLEACSPRAAPIGLPSAERGPLIEVGSEPPLVTCVLAEPASPELVALAARRFLQQDWPHRELLVLRGPGGVHPAALPIDPRIRCVERPASARHAWREVALAEAHGTVLAVWSPLTWYAPDRLSQQVAELGSTSSPRLVVPSVLAVDLRDHTTRRVAEAEVIEAVSLCAHRHGWTAAGAASRRGERADIAVLVDPGIAHSRGEPALAADAARLLGDHLGPYTVAVATYVAGRGRPPLVSCLMPTYNRRRFAARAIDAFLAQDHPRTELVILDDGEDAIDDLVPPGSSVRYHRLSHRATIGRKRQLLCELAHGDVLVQWDDDDWYSPARVRRQVAPLAAGAADISGILHGYLVDTRARRFWRGELPLHEGRLHAVIVAGTLAFTRDAWRAAGGYPDRSLGEEVALLEAVVDGGGRVASIVNDGVYLCVRHGGNSWRLRFDAIEGPPGWTEIPTPDFLPAPDAEFYRSLGARGGPVAAPAAGPVT